MKTTISVIIAVVLFYTALIGIAFSAPHNIPEQTEPLPVRQQPIEVEPGWNLEIFPFADNNGNLLLEFGENYIPAHGVITFTATGENRTWDAQDRPAKIRVPYGTNFEVTGYVPAARGAYQCPPRLRYETLTKGRGYLEYPCIPQNPLDFFYNLWIALIKN